MCILFLFLSISNFFQPQFSTWHSPYSDLFLKEKPLLFPFYSILLLHFIHFLIFLLISLQPLVWMYILLQFLHPFPIKSFTISLYLLISFTWPLNNFYLQMTFMYLYPFSFLFLSFIYLLLFFIDVMAFFLSPLIFQNFHQDAQALVEMVLLPFHTFLLMHVFLHRINDLKTISQNT